ncbi:heat shock protein 70 family [Mycena crocata]|nr:heat shock protein 70 family [Mycena crocata]
MRTLVSRAETFHGHPILRAILAVPAHFGDTHRTLLHEAARLANVTLLRIITEPTATAIGYGFADTASDEQRLLVLDVGASVSASVIENDSGALDFLARVTRARKSPFDDRIARYAEEMYVDMSGSREAVLREALHVRAEEAMFGLSTHEMAVIEVPTVDNTVFPVELTRHDFIRISVDIFEDVMQCVEEALVEANVTASEVDQASIILAGGSAYIPRLSELLSQRFSDKIPLSSSNIRRDEAVVYGAGLHARVFEEAGDDFLCCVEITPLAFGIEEPGSIFAVVLPRNSVLPNSKTRRFNLTEREVRIFVGHGEYTTGNATHLIGHLVLPRTLTGEVQLRFDVDLAGVLTVVATNARGRSFFSSPSFGGGH